MDADEQAAWDLALNLMLAHTYKTDYSTSPPVSQVDRNGLRDAIAAALRRAREEEREACARLVETGDAGEPHVREFRPDKLAAAIRARNGA